MRNIRVRTNAFDATEVGRYTEIRTAIAPTKALANMIAPGFEVASQRGLMKSFRIDLTFLLGWLILSSSYSCLEGGDPAWI